MEGSSSSFVGLKPKYDVFLSFRGEDTRKIFVSHLYSALTRKGIHTFRDDRSLEKGKTIKDELFEAIEESRLAVIVLSKNYGSSRWCLEELMKIIECQVKRKQAVIPIFYGIDESEKCSIIDRFAEGFAKREQTDSKDGYFIEEERVKSWRKALTEAIESGCWDVSQSVEQYGEVGKVEVANYDETPWKWQERSRMHRADCGGYCYKLELHQLLSFTF